MSRGTRYRTLRARMVTAGLRRVLRMGAMFVVTVALVLSVQASATASAAPKPPKIPVITSLAPSTGSTTGGTTVTFSGTDLTPRGYNVTLEFGSQGATPVSQLATTITVTTPAEPAGTVAVTAVFTKGKKHQQSIAAGSFTFVPPPVVTGVSPAAGPTSGGNTVTVSGTALGSADSVLFGPTAGDIVSDTDTSITVQPPASTTPGTVDVSVVTGSGASPTGAVTDQYTYVVPPVVTSVTPDNGLVAGGTSVSITGTGFDNATGVQFGKVAASSFLVVSSTLIDAYAPKGASVGPVDVTVVTAGGTSVASGSDLFRYVSNVIPTLPPSPTTNDGAQGLISQIPCSSGACPTVDVGPVTGLRNGQYVSIKATNFPASGSFRVALCSAVTSATDPSCLSGSWQSVTYNPVTVPVADNAPAQNLTSVNYPVFPDPSGEGNNVLPAEDIENLNNGLNTPGFYCDNLADLCSLVITQEDGQGADVGFGPAVDASNSVVIPLSYQSESTGCPANAPQLQTESSTSLEQLLPVAVSATCSGAHGVVALNTTNDTKTVVSDFACDAATDSTCSSPDVAFIDNPQDSSQMAQIKKKGYALIPVAVSASTVSYLAGAQINGEPVPISTYNLTPNMVAGLITSRYQSPSGSLSFDNGKPVFKLSDNLAPAVQAAGLTCAKLYLCPLGGYANAYYLSNLDAFDLFNPLSTNALLRGGISPQEFGSFMPDVATGSSYEVSDWLCHAPSPSSTATVFTTDAQGGPVATSVPVADGAKASSTLTSAPLGSSVWPPNGDTATPWVFPSCQGTSTFPSISGSSDQFSAAQSPALQAKAMRSWAYGSGQLPSPPSQVDPLAAFGIMDSSEASFYGLDTAALQNASGHFVAPTTASVEAALSSAKPCGAGNTSCPAGTYAIDYSASDPSAYPLPDVTYALVPTDPQTAAKATTIKNFLTNMVNFSSTGSLPAGYYPMPASMTTAALADITSDVHGPTPPTKTSTSTTTPPTTTPAGTQSDTQQGTSQVLPFDAGSGGFSNNGTSTNSTSGSTTRTTTPSVHLPPPVVPADLAVVAIATLSKYLLPLILLLALLCLIAGPTLLAVQARRRRTGGPT